MGSFDRILSKLEAFSRKYYTKILIRGILLFFAIGLLFFLAIMGLEYLLWLDQTGRLILFLLFLAVELFLLYRFIGIPIFYILKIRKGLSNKRAALLIGKHFPKVNDKLYNLLELAENSRASELLLASIEQRSKKLGDVPFTKAINFKESYKYAKYALIPLVIIGFIWISGNIVAFFNSYNRVVNYDVAFEKPAPFSFQLLNESLEVLDNESLTIRVGTHGEVQPENVYLIIDGEELLLKNVGGIHSYTFEPPVQEGDFYFTANGWDSRSYSIRSFNTPVLVGFTMSLDFPNYLKRQSETISGTGNAVVPEGTRIAWEITGNHVDEIKMVKRDTTILFNKEAKTFDYTESIFSDLDYELSTSNSYADDFERLGYRLEIVKDAYPTVKVEQVLDSLNPNQSFYIGQAADDYKVNQVRAVCYPSDDNQDIQRVVLETPRSNVHQFYYTFPSGFSLREGKGYKLYFEIVDNDGLQGGKSVRSRIFDTHILDDKQLKNRELDFQNSLLNRLDKTVEVYKEQKERLSKINTKQREEKGMDFEDKSEIRDFINKQEQQEELMQKFSRELKESLEKNASSDEMKKLLQERLERQEMEARKNEKLLEELNKLADKIDKEELKEKLEELAKKQSSGARNLEQLLELTKRYYVNEKMAQLSRDLDELSRKQESLSKHTFDQELDNKLQEDLNKEFEQLSKELDELRKDNKELKKPLEMNVDPSEQDGVKKDQKDALEELNKHQGEEKSSNQDGKQSDSRNNAQMKQKSAAQKMEEMSKKLQQSTMGGGGSSITEDAEMLRQILDNLVTFSFRQEALFEDVENLNEDVSQFSKTVRTQKELRRLFEHVDDSLFALSLRRAELSEFVNEQITEVYYNIDKSLESIAENQIFQGASYQQYVVNATNALADFLADILDNMQQNMQAGQGQGQGSSDFQLPDIIKGQQGIQDKMQGDGKQGEKQGEQESNGQGEGKQGERQGEQNEGKGQNGEGKEKGKGQEERGSEGSGGSGEMELSEIYEIYKEQQQIRQQLEKQLEDFIENSDKNLAKKLVRQMEDFENDLLENGITQRTMNKVNTIQHQLLKLKNATLKQGKKKERESKTDDTKFVNPITTKPELLKEYQNDVEILNRQALPLRQNYENKVKVYFKND